MKCLQRIKIVESLGENMNSIVHESVAGEQRVGLALEEPVRGLLEIFPHWFCVRINNSVSGDVDILICVLFYVDLVQI